MTDKDYIDHAINSIIFHHKYDESYKITKEAEEIIDSLDMDDDAKERLKEEVQCMINEEYVQESYRKLKLYEHQQKTGKPAFVRIL